MTLVSRSHFQAFHNDTLLTEHGVTAFVIFLLAVVLKY